MQNPDRLFARNKKEGAVKYFILVLPLVIILGISSFARSSRIEAYAVNDQLVTSIRNPGAATSARRQALRFVDGQTVNTCKQYWQLMESVALDESQANQIAKSSYLECDALMLMQRSEPIDRTKLNLDRSGKDLLKRLNLRTFLSSVNNQCQTARCHLDQLFPEYVSSNSTVARYESEDWLFIMEVVAAANLNGNDSPDWIVWVVDEAKTGSYRSYFTLVIYDPAGEHELRAVMHPMSAKGSKAVSVLVN